MRGDPTAWGLFLLLVKKNCFSESGKKGFYHHRSLTIALEMYICTVLKEDSVGCTASEISLYLC